MARLSLGLVVCFMWGMIISTIFTSHPVGVFIGLLFAVVYLSNKLTDWSMNFIWKEDEVNPNQKE